MKRETTVAKILLESGVATFRPEEPFTYSSGLRSPIYLDNRVLISFPEARKRISLALEELIREHQREVGTIAGTATAGIPWAAWIAAGMNLPMVYVRDKAKGHGQRNQIEGVLESGKQVVVVEDLVTTGGSCLNAAAAIREAGCEVSSVVAIFTYRTAASRQAFEQSNLALHALTDFRTMTDVAVREGHLTKQSLQTVLDWADDPVAWSAKMEDA